MIVHWEAGIAPASVLDAAIKGEPVTPYFGVGFRTMEHFGEVFTPRRVALIEELKTHGAQSIYWLAKRLAHNYSNVHTDVGKLIEFGIVEKNEAGKVFVPWDEIDVQWPKPCARIPHSR
jgi:predicted transcriptional regulator